MLLAISSVFGTAGSAEPPTVTLPRITAPVEIASFLDMDSSAASAEMLAIDGFTQRTPRDGQPSRERTVVYLGYTERDLHVVFVAFDREPELVRGRLRRRDSIGGDDIVEVMLDTFHDRRRAYAFVANPYGVQWDALWTEGQEFDESFDTVWHTDAVRTERGYVVHFRIPFASLRFPARDEQTWGLILLREIQRGQAEQSFWPPVSSTIEGRLNQAATLTGLRGISPGSNRLLIPYASYRAFEVLEDGPDGAGFARDPFDAAVGADFKTVIDDSLVLDATLNPDFSQVESDRPQVTVNRRFEVFFPERRPFFLENADVFATPFNLVFTRRIADPRAGVRLTGKRGPYAVGALVIDDTAPGKRADVDDPQYGDAALFTIARIARDMGRQSRIGLLYTGRELGDAHNRVIAADARFKLDDNWTTVMQAATSSDRDAAGRDHHGPAYAVEVNRNGRQLNYAAGYGDIGDDFRTETGFVNRAGFRETWQFLSYSFRPEGDTVISWGPELFASRLWDRDGTRLDDQIEGSMEIHLTGGNSVELNYRRARERLMPRDFASLQTVSDFAMDVWVLEFESETFDAVRVQAEVGWGDRINFAVPAGAEPSLAEWIESEIEVNVRPHERLTIDNKYLYSRFGERATDTRILDVHIVRSACNWQISRELSVRLIGQYEATRVDPSLTRQVEGRRLNADLLVTYQVNPWTAMYVGYNGNVRNVDLESVDGRDTLRRTTALTTNDANQLFAKLSYVVRF